MSRMLCSHWEPPVFLLVSPVRVFPALGRGACDFLLCGFCHRRRYGVKKKRIDLAHRARYGVISALMDREAFRQAMIEIGKKGGLARAKSMTAKERQASATKASKAAAEARKRRAKEKRKRID